MGKKNILVCDNKKVFMKMFKRKFNNEFEFTDKAILNGDENSAIDFEKLVFVVYNKFELIEFLKLYKKGTNVMVCIFNKNLYTALAFLEEFSDLVLVDGSKTRNEIIKDLKLGFKNSFNFKQQIAESVFSNNHTEKKQSYDSLKSLIISSVT